MFQVSVHRPGAHLELQGLLLTWLLRGRAETALKQNLSPEDVNVALFTP